MYVTSLTIKYMCYNHRAKHAKREERYRKKTQYKQGMWNVNTVMMGGLGVDPHSSGSSSEEGHIQYIMHKRVCVMCVSAQTNILYLI